MNPEHLRTGLSKGRKLLPVLLILSGAGAIVLTVAADHLGAGDRGSGTKWIGRVATLEGEPGAVARSGYAAKLDRP